MTETADLLPMLATPWREPFDDPDWWFEVKWDGYRVLLHSEDGRLRLKSRRGNDLTSAFPEISGPVESKRLVLDGEIVVFGADGTPSFHRLQQRNGLAGAAAKERGAQYPATVVVFDVLVDGELVIDEPLEERRARLDALDLGTLVATRPLPGDGRSIWDAVVNRGMEGIVAKRAGSRYRPGRRSPDWRKIAHRKTINAVVGGFLPGDGSRSDHFGSILVGLFDPERTPSTDIQTNGGLVYLGAVGSGFDRADLEAMSWALGELRRDDCPFVTAANIPAGALWVEPAITVKVEYKELTPDGRLRAPVFKGAAEIGPGEAMLGSELP